MSSNIKSRRKVLEKIAQAVPSTPATPATVVAQPPSFLASSIYPNIRTGYNSASVSIIDQIVKLLNTALHYSTAGKTNFQTLRGTNFSLDASTMASPDSKNLLLLSQKVFKNLLNNNSPFIKPLNGTQVADIIRLLSSPEIGNLSASNPKGPLNQNFSGSLKTNITDLLNNLKLANPIQAA